MKSIVSALCLVLFTSLAFAADVATKSDAQAFVKQAVAYAQQNSRDKFLNEVRNPSGKFHFKKGENKDLYIFVYDEKGVVLAHGVRLELSGRNRWNDKDPAGKYFVQEWTALVHKSGSGWANYKEYNPSENNKIMDKVSFVELYNGMVIGCGVYGN